MQIANFTPDDFKWMHNGHGGVLKAGKVQDFEEKTGNFILNSNGGIKKGLVRLEWFDPNEDPDYMKRKKVESRDRYEKFWQYQIEIFNQHNEQLKNERKPYERPPKIYVEKAEELELVILSPHNISVPDGPGGGAQVDTIRQIQDETQTIRAENQELRTTVETLLSKVEQLLTLNPPPEEIESPIDIEAEKRKFMGLSANTLKDWIKKNQEEIKTWPSELLTALDNKHTKTYDGEGLDPSILE